MRPSRLGAARRLRPLALLVLLALAACDLGRETQAEILARRQAIDPPQLWRVEVLGGDGAVQAAVYVCADSTVRETFTRARAEVNGEPCKDTTYPNLRPNGWVLSCQVNGRPFGISATTVGDLDRDFRLDFVLTELYHYRTPESPRPETASQVRHFLRMGPGPSGWDIGDQAKPGRRPGRT